MHSPVPTKCRHGILWSLIPRGDVNIYCGALFVILAHHSALFDFWRVILERGVRASCLLIRPREAREFFVHRVEGLGSRCDGIVSETIRFRQRLETITQRGDPNATQQQLHANATDRKETQRHRERCFSKQFQDINPTKRDRVWKSKDFVNCWYWLSAFVIRSVFACL